MSAQRLTRWYAFWARMADVRGHTAHADAAAHWVASALDARELYAHTHSWEKALSAAGNRLWARGEPLDYVLGWTPFVTSRMAVRRPLLIPRQDTETWLVALLDMWRPGWKTVVDLCTGTGCIAISIAKHLQQQTAEYDSINAIPALPNPSSETSKAIGFAGSDESSISSIKIAKDIQSHPFGPQVWAFDKSRKACITATHNAKINNVSMHVVQTDIMNSNFALPPCDIVVSNPPYIARSSAHYMAPSVRRWEDSRATITANKMDFYRRIVDLAAGRPLVLELDGTHSHARSVLSYARSKGYSLHVPLADAANRVRALLIDAPPGTNRA